MVDVTDPTVDVSAGVRKARLVELHRWQRLYDMEPREDSELTRRYVAGEIAWPVDVVARELVATHFLYRSTLYGEWLQDYMRGMARRLRARHPRLSWSDTWTIVRFYGPFTLKLYMVMQCQAPIPSRLGGE